MVVGRVRRSTSTLAFGVSRPRGTRRTLEPGGRIAVNVTNLGRRPYRSLTADVSGILQDRLGLLLRGEIIWRKARGAGGSDLVSPTWEPGVR